VTLSADQWKGLIKAAAAVTAAGVVVTIAGSLKGYGGIAGFGTFAAFCGFVLFLVARIHFSRSTRPD
jgi:hypothetical protein